jgi:hypothetical protein
MPVSQASRKDSLVNNIAREFYMYRPYLPEFPM